MVLITERQQKARDLARHIGQMKGTYVVNVMPLAAGAHLRVHAEHPHCNHVRGAIQDLGWKVNYLGNTTRFCTDDGTMRLAEILEVEIGLAATDPAR